MRIKNKMVRAKNTRWNPQEIRDAYVAVRNELKKVPTAREFEIRTGGGVAAISQGRYDCRINSWRKFVTSMGDTVSKKHAYWNRKTIIAEFRRMKRSLGRVPKSIDLNAYGKGISDAIKHGKFGGGIKTYAGFLEQMGEFPPRGQGFYVDGGQIEIEYFTLKDFLGRIPGKQEFKEHFPMSWKTIHSGRYSEGIHNYMKFIEGLGEFNNNWKGHPEKIREVFYLMKSENGHVTQEEFCKRFGGAANAIYSGEYRQDVGCWNDFLRSLGEKLNLERKHKWTPRNVRSAFYELKKRLGRVPKLREFGKEYCGALHPIGNGSYNRAVRTYNQFLTSLGEKLNREVRSKSAEIWDRKDLVEAYFILREIKKEKISNRLFIQHYGPEPFKQIRMGNVEGIRSWKDLERIVGENKILD